MPSGKNIVGGHPMHRKIKSRARQTRRHQAKPLAMAEKTNALSIRRLNQSHREEVAGLRHLIFELTNHDTKRMMSLSDRIDELNEQINSLKRILHGYAVIGANATPDAQEIPPGR